MTIAAVICDLNGVLVDTDRWHQEAFRRVLAELGATLMTRTIGSVVLGGPIALHKIGIQADVEAVITREVHCYQEIAQATPPAYLGAQVLIRSLVSRHPGRSGEPVLVGPGVCHPR